MNDNWRGFLSSEKKPRGFSKTFNRKRALGPWNPWILRFTGASDPRVQKSSDSLNPAGFSNSRIFRCIFLFFFSLLDCRISKSADARSSSPGNSLDPCGSSDPTSVAKGKWLLNQESLTDRVGRRSDRGPSNSLRFREAAARFGSLISFRI